MVERIRINGTVVRVVSEYTPMGLRVSAHTLYPDYKGDIYETQEYMCATDALAEMINAIRDSVQ